jgi:hypothetical protein
MRLPRRRKKDRVQELTRWVADTYLGTKKMCPYLNHSEILKIVSEIYIECRNENLSQSLDLWIGHDMPNRKLLHFVSFVMTAESKTLELPAESYHLIREGLSNAGIEDTVIS